MLELALWLKKNGFRADQVQAFLPSPMATATAMYHSGKNPLKKHRARQRGGRHPEGHAGAAPAQGVPALSRSGELAVAARGAEAHGSRRSDRQRQASPDSGVPAGGLARRRGSPFRTQHTGLPKSGTGSATAVKTRAKLSTSGRRGAVLGFYPMRVCACYPARRAIKVPGCLAVAGRNSSIRDFGAHARAGRARVKYGQVDRTQIRRLERRRRGLFPPRRRHRRGVPQSARGRGAVGLPRGHRCAVECGHARRAARRATWRARSSSCGSATRSSPTELLSPSACDAYCMQLAQRLPGHRGRAADRAADPRGDLLDARRDRRLWRDLVDPPVRAVPARARAASRARCCGSTRARSSSSSGALWARRCSGRRASAISSKLVPDGLSRAAHRHRIHRDHRHRHADHARAQRQRFFRLHLRRAAEGAPRSSSGPMSTACCRPIRASCRMPR